MKMDKDKIDIKEVLVFYRELVWSEVSKYLCDPQYPDSFRIPTKYSNETKKHWKMVADYPERKGKYLRPSLILLTAEAMGVENKTVIAMAAAMQLSEEWMLAHDDIEDDSLLRRGKPALHRIYGNSLAINAGDALHVMMWKVLYDGIEMFDRKKAKKIFDEFNTMLTRTALGQSVEISWTEGKGRNFEDEDWYFVADGKTSYYTIAGPMRLGALAAGADEEQLNQLSEFGINLGRCFQLIDDVLDVSGDFGGLKEMGNDVYEGKRTVILGHLLKNANDADRKRVIEIVNKSRTDKSPEEVAFVIGKMKEYGSVEYAKGLAEDFGKKSLEIFENKLTFLKEQPAREKIRKLINFIVTRDH